MNKAKLVLASAIMVAITTAQAYTIDSDAEKIGYTIGADMGSTLGEFAGNNDNISFDALIVGLRDAYEGDELSMSAEEMDATMQTFAQKRMEEFEKEQAQLQEKNRTEGQKFLEANAKKEGVKTTDSGLQYQVMEEGDGEKPTADSNVTVNYEGRLIDGTVFDSSKNSNEPVTFNVSDVIDGWVEGLQLMKEGAEYRFFIPADLAYGEMGAGEAVPPNSTLIFDVELLEINDTNNDGNANEQTSQEVGKAIEEAKANAEKAEQDAKEIAAEVQQDAKEAAEEMAVEVEKAKVEAEKAVDQVERENQAQADESVERDNEVAVKETAEQAEVKETAEQAESDVEANAEVKRQEVESPDPEVNVVKDTEEVSEKAKAVQLESQETEVNASDSLQEMGDKATTDAANAQADESNIIEDAIESTGESIENATQAIGDTVSDAADTLMGTEKEK